MTPFVVLTVISGLVLVALAVAIRELPPARRIRDGVVGVVFLASAAGIGFGGFHPSGFFWPVLVLPIYLVVDSVRYIDLDDVSEESTPAHRRPRPAPEPAAPRRSAGSRERRAARAAERREALRVKHGEAR
ncbi:hypothetical protein AB0H71_32520 [Nocardia sp. NPDC050697]|uniref:hypothetical protein n=1 Tax=Nocardia sp. NPDC050697 TaxID=3155158 RepID=UPI0033F04D8F